MTVIHARSVRDELNFSLGSTATSVADFPTRIVATKTTGGVVSRTFTPQSGSYQPVTGGSRQDYDAESGSAADVFVNNATIRLELY